MPIFLRLLAAGHSGSSYSDAKPVNDLWAFDLGSGTWQQIPQHPPVPLPRFEQAYAQYTPAGGSQGICSQGALSFILCESVCPLLLRCTLLFRQGWQGLGVSSAKPSSMLRWPDTLLDQSLD